MSSDRYHKAAKDGMLNVLREANKKEVNAKDVYGRTPVLWSAFEGQLDALRLLVGRGGEPDKCDQFGCSALHLAAAKGHIQCVDFLVKFGVNLFAIDIDRHTAKDLAAMNNRDDILRYLDAATAHLEAIDKKKCKQFKEQAEKQREKRLREYNKRQQKIEESLEAQQQHSQHLQQQRSATMLGDWKQRILSTSHGNLKMAGTASSSLAGGTLTSNSTTSGGTKFSALVGGTLSGARGKVQRLAEASKQARQLQQHQLGGDFVGDAGKRSVRSLQRNPDVLYVGTFGNNAGGDPLKRGKITDVFDVVEETETASDGENGGGGGASSVGQQSARGTLTGRHQRRAAGGQRFNVNGGGTMSRSISQPDFLAGEHVATARGEDDDDEEAAGRISEEVMMQRPAGLFDRPMLGSLAFRRSVSAALSELHPDTSSVGSSNNSSHKSASMKQRSHLVISDSDSGGSACTDDDEEDEDEAAENGFSSLGRFLAAWGLEEHMHIFEKQQIDLDTLMLLTESDLKSLNLPLGPFRKLAIAIQERKSALTAPGPITDSRL